MDVHRFEFRIGSAIVAVWLLATSAPAADWPMWRHDASRSAATDEDLAGQLHLQWVRELPPLTHPAWPDQPKLRFDEHYEPIVADGTMFVGSPQSDWLLAYDVRSGAEKWKFYADGPIRFAPLAWRGNVYFASDDGYLYCLDGASGKLNWKFRGGPSDRKVLGNERLISSWPARGAPVLADGTVYFAASIWPFMGTFIHALDAETGAVVWTNDGNGSMYLTQPHNSPAFAGVAPQGYLAVIGERLFIPSGRAVPGCFDRRSGKFLYFQISRNKGAGGYGVAVSKKLFFTPGNAFDLASGDGLMSLGSALPVIADRVIYTGGSSVHAYDAWEIKVTEYKDRRGRKMKKGELEKLWDTSAKLDLELKAGSRLYGFAGNEIVALDLPTVRKEPRVSWKTKVDGTPVRMLAASARLFIVTKEGRIHCYGPEKTLDPQDLREQRVDGAVLNNERAATVAEIIERTGVTEGFCISFGSEDGSLTEELVRRSKLHTIVVEPDPREVASLRRRYDTQGVYGTRVSVLAADPLDIELPPYLASLIVSRDVSAAGFESTVEFSKKIFRSLRPYGGVACLLIPAERHEEFAKAVEAAKLPNAKVARSGNFTLMTRVGALPGSADWTHLYANAANTAVSKDKLVKAPLGILWFGGSSNEKILPRHGHGPSEQVVGGRLFIEGPDMIRAVDVYTGRVLWEKSLPGLGAPYDRTGHQPGANAIGSNYVSVHDGIYVAYGDRCLILDPTTGKTISELILPPIDGGKRPRWTYLAVWEDLIIAGASPIAYESKAFGGKTHDGTSSKRLVVLDRHNAKKLWQREAAFGFRHNAISVGGGKVFCIDMLPDPVLEQAKRRGLVFEGKPRLACLDARSGEEVWGTTENVFGTWLGYSAEHDILLQCGRASRDMLKSEPSDRMITYRGKDGSIVWNERISHSGPCLLHRDSIIAQTKAINLLTGKPVMRTNPLTGLESSWGFQRNYGCNTILGSEYLLTFRSAAAGFYDLLGDSGTGNFGGFRSSCTSNLIVANGVLNAPDYTRTCRCSYQNQTSLALVHMPELEMWTFNDLDVGRQRIRRLGINFGAAGDRKDAAGTLWLEYPTVGGPSPDISLAIRPEQPRWFRRYSSRIEGTSNWITASGAVGLRSIRLTLAPESEDVYRYTVRLYFAEPDDLEAGERVFSVAVQGKPVVANVDIARETGGSRRAIVKEFTGVLVKRDLEVTFESAASVKTGTLLCGLEVVAED